MKHLLIITMLFLMLVFIKHSHAVEKNEFGLKDFVVSDLLSIGSNPIIVTAVKQANSIEKTLEQIKVSDKKWRESPGVNAFMKAMQESKCGRVLKELKKSNNIYAEIFVMDNQGANVCMSDKTSDYWQGDEAKFQRSFRKGKGGIHIGDVEFDESTHIYLSQVSVPVKDGKKVIGAITFGIDVEEID